MLQVYQSNRLEVLVTLLAEQIKLPGSGSVFNPETVMVHSPGMSQWLKLQLAQHNSIAANIDFPLPSSFIWRLYQNLLEGVPAESPFNKDKMSWRIYDLLPQRLAQEAFASVAQYLASKKPITQGQDFQQQSFEQLRRFQLAEKIADVFDNYLMYRQHWLEHWQTGANDLPEDGSDDDIKHQEWQAILWRDLVQDIETSYENNTEEAPLSRAHMHQLLLQQLSKHKDLTSVLPERLFVFGVSTLPKSQLEVLQALGEHIDVQIMWLNPCALFWGDILSDKTLARISSKDAKQAVIAQQNIQQKEQYFIVGNPLLASWGKVGRDYLDNLTKAELDLTDLFIESEAETLLEKIQQDILLLEFRGEQMPLTPEQIHSDFGKRRLATDDDSILVHSCHSQIRELEVLRDKLLGWFEQDPTLEPKDVLVMVPDVEQYAPFIDSVFAKRRDKHKEYIPYTIADRGGLLENPLLNTFNQLLLLPGSRFNISEMLDHLEVPALMTRFELSEAEMVLLKQWIADCQIKWAKSADHKQNWSLPEIELNTWVYGLKRMLLGIAVSEQAMWQDILAYEHIEGLNAQTLGKLLNYFSFLIELEQQLSVEKTLQGWCETVSFLVDFLFAEQSHDINTQIAIEKIRDANQRLLGYAEHASAIRQTDTFGYRLLHHYFVNGLNESGVVQRFLAGSMNFCTLMPMRSVPFKVVCVLGLNEGDYPRQVDPISFDLVGLNAPRKGDRSRKHDDRYLFLEALVSARQKLHLSFVGQSSKNNNSLVPSVILSELLDYVSDSFLLPDNENVERHLILQHKLQPFNSAYFAADNRALQYQSFDRDWFDLANQNSAEATEDNSSAPLVQMPVSEQTEGCELDQLIEFACHPIKYFYKNVLDVRLELTEQELSDHEVFSHDGLNRFKTLTELMDDALQNKTSSAAKYLRSGQFPSQRWGEKLFQDYSKQASELTNHVFELLGETIEVETPNLTLEVQDKVLHGKVALIKQANRTGDMLYHGFVLRAGDIRPQDKLTAWLNHLTRSAAALTGVTLMIDNKGKLQWFDPMKTELAAELLLPWLTWFEQNKHRLLKWHIGLALPVVEGQNKGLSPQALQKVIADQFAVNSFKRNLASDPYVSKVMTGAEELEQVFYQINDELVAPMVAQLKVQSKSQSKPEVFLPGEDE